MGGKFNDSHNPVFTLPPCFGILGFHIQPEVVLNIVRNLPYFVKLQEHEFTFLDTDDVGKILGSLLKLLRSVFFWLPILN